MGSFDVRNPATGDVIGSAPDMTAAHVPSILDRAQQAFKGWRSTTARDRSVLLRRWHDLMHDKGEELARLITAEQGKPLAEARGEVAYGAAFVEWFAEEAKRVYGDIIPSPWADKRVHVIKQPVGVVAAITPWNFPLAMITRKVAPALAAGCAIVVKPSELTPLTAVALADLAREAGIPDGVMTVLTCADGIEVGQELTTHPLVRKVSFTGSTAVGKTLLRQCAGTVKKVSMELGGNAPFIVFDDADLDAAVDGAIASKFRNSGQTCVCANRFLVQDGVHNAFAAKLARAVSALKVGNGVDEGVTQGPLIDEAAVRKVERHVEDAVAKGAGVAIGGDRHRLGGTFFQPTVLTDVTAEMAVACEETFGPVAPLFRFAAEDQAVRLANDTPYGLAAYVYTREIGRVIRVSEALEYGMVAVNSGTLSTEVAPFGGIKESGFGREGSKYGIDAYLNAKYLCLGGV